jgi:hypothetical protein
MKILPLPGNPVHSIVRLQQILLHNFVVVYSPYTKKKIKKTYITIVQYLSTLFSKNFEEVMQTRLLEHLHKWILYEFNNKKCHL